MTTSIINLAERSAKLNINVMLKYFSTHAGVNFNVYRTIGAGGGSLGDDEYSAVFGVSAKTPSSDLEKITTIMGILTAEQFTPIDDLSVGLTTGAYLYTTSDEIRVGDVIKLIRDVVIESRGYKITSKESIGTTMSIIMRYVVSSLGD